MEIFEELKLPIASKTNQEIAVCVQQKMAYNWKAAHKLSASSVGLSHDMSRAFVALAVAHCADLPETITQRVCSWCSALLLPAKTCTVRVRRVRRSAQAGETKTNYRNERVYQCLVCHHAPTVLSGCRKRKKFSNVAKETAEAAAKPSVNPGSASKVAFKGKPLTSYTALSSSFHGLPNQTSSTATRFNFLNSTRPASASGVGTGTAGSSPQAPLSLLELEQQNKKKKRKSLDGVTSIGAAATVPTTSPSAHSSLGSTSSVPAAPVVCGGVKGKLSLVTLLNGATHTKGKGAPPNAAVKTKSNKSPASSKSLAVTQISNKQAANAPAPSSLGSLQSMFTNNRTRGI